MICYPLNVPISAQRLLHPDDRTEAARISWFYSAVAEAFGWVRRCGFGRRASSRKTSSRRGASCKGRIPEVDGEFVTAIQYASDLYGEPCHSNRRVVHVDERSTQLR